MAYAIQHWTRDVTACYGFFAAHNSLAENAAKRDQVTLMLSSRHIVPTTEQLEKIAGGRDPLIKKLLTLRLDDDTPFVGVRAAKYLLGYLDVPDVAAAIDEDIGREDRAGLARVYALQIDTIDAPDIRRHIAELLVERGERSPTFRVYAKVLLDSKDQEVSKLAREKLM